MRRATATTTTTTAPASPSWIVALVLACLVAAAFWVPSYAVGRGYFPAPLDDVYIHFDFARSLGKGHPFEWIPGQGYSSGETSPLYAFVLALGWVVGFRGRLLGVWAAIVAILSVASLLRSIRTLTGPHSSACPSWLGWIFALVPLSIGIVDWALFSGMEVAAFAAAIGSALVALANLLRSASSRGGKTREALQWRLGAWGAALVLLRPEAVVIVLVMAVFAARSAGRRSGFMVVLRSALPGALATLAILGLNLLATGDARSAGAQLKLLSSNPYMSDVDRARVLVENLITFWLKVVRGELAVKPVLLAVLPLLALVGAVVRREYRGVGATCLLAAIAWILLVSWNGNSPHHNFRYYAPGLVLVAIGSSLGLATLAHLSRRTRVGRASMLLLGVATIAIGAAKIPAQARHFRTSSANIRDQHVEVGERVAAHLPQGSRILLGDAGAIPYVSNLTAIDALGLGGYRGIPFAHAAVHGEAATIELIERLSPADRPTHFALYPNWFGLLTSRFGVEIDRVTIENNVICGSPTKAIYRADWSSLSFSSPSSSSSTPSTLLDEIDVGDVIDEEAHAYAPPLPHGGWMTLDVLKEDEAGAANRFDGGRTIPEGASESFTLLKNGGAASTIRVRVDRDAKKISARVHGVVKELTLGPVRDGYWRAASVTVDGALAKGDVITLEATSGAYRDYHVWIFKSE